MKIFNKKLNGRIVLVSEDSDKKELILNVDGQEHKIYATQVKEIRNGDYVLFRRSDIAQVYDYSQDEWQNKNRCFFDLRYSFSNQFDSHYGFLDEDTPIYLINEFINTSDKTATYDELLQYVEKLEKQVGTLSEGMKKSEETLRKIDNHIRSTPEPIQYIVEELKSALPEYQMYQRII